MKQEFVHLHNHTEYSLLDGMLRFSKKGEPSSFLSNVKKHGMQALAMTDHGNMFGAIEFYKCCKQTGIKPIIGCEIYVAKDHKDKKDNKMAHLVLLVKDFKGYQNLMQLVSKAWLEGFYYKPRIDKELLSKYSEGLIALSACLKGSVTQLCVKGDIEGACKEALEFQKIMGEGNFYLELMDHGIEDEKKALKGLLAVSEKTGIPVVATNDCHYEKKEDAKIHDIHLCISTGATLEDEKRFKMETHELYFKSPQEMKELFSKTPQAIENTVKIADKCNLELPKEGFVLPHFDIPENFKDTAEYLKDLCYKGLTAKLNGAGISDEYKQRLDYELGIVNSMGFGSYFLIVADFIDYARQQNIPVGPGRGSGAGSMVAYSLNITKVDPIINGLLFERFLNPDRVSMPDLDIDFSDDGREKVIKYVRKKYGEKNVAQIITFGTMKAKLALRDTARAMGISVAETNRIAKMIPNTLDATVDMAMRQKEIKAEIKKDKKIEQLFEYASKMEGLKRHTGVHAAGIVVTRDEVVKYTPLSKGSKQVITTQYEGETLVDLGLLKIDFLGLRTLSVIERATKFIKEMRGIDINIDKIPLDDKKTFQLLTSGHTIGVFQLESSGMRDLVKRLKPTEFADISALVALYRPGPMQSGMLESFVKRKHGKEQVKYEHQMMETILKETHGTMVYQEQIMEISKRLGGFSPGEADTLRKAMGKKKLDLLEKSRESFIKGCAVNKITKPIAEKIFNQMVQFAGYGFNKSHSVAYALISYQTAYLKANYPTEFICSAITSEIGHSSIDASDKENRMLNYLQDAKRMGLKIFGPDVQKSKQKFNIEEQPDGTEAIRYALSAVKNVGTEVCKQIVASREKNGEFKNLDDFCMRPDIKNINKKAIESLAKCDGLSSLFSGMKPEASKAYVLENLEEIVDSSAKYKSQRESLEGGLFGGGDISKIGAGKLKYDAKKAKPFSQSETLALEKEVLGVYISGHPIVKIREKIGKLVPFTVEHVINSKREKNYNLLCVISRMRKKQTRTKQNWAQLTVEDETGQIVSNVFPRVYHGLEEKLVVNQPLILKANVKFDEMGTAELMITDVENIANLVVGRSKSLIIKITKKPDKKQIEQLKQELAKKRGIVDAYLAISDDKNKETLIGLDGKIGIHMELLKYIAKTFGLQNWTVK